jgi:hypothetical protein
VHFVGVYLKSLTKLVFNGGAVKYELNFKQYFREFNASSAIESSDKKG